MASGEGQLNPSTSGDAGKDHHEDFGNEYGPPLPTQEELREMEHRRLVGEATNLMLNFANDPKLAKYMSETAFEDVQAQLKATTTSPPKLDSKKQYSEKELEEEIDARLARILGAQKQGKKHDRKRKKSTDFNGYLGSQSTFDKAKKHKKHAAVPSSFSSSESSSESSEEERRSKKRSRRHRHGKAKRKTKKSRSRRADDSSIEDSSTDSSDSEDGHFYANKKNFYRANPVPGGSPSPFPFRVPGAVCRQGRNASAVGARTRAVSSNLNSLLSEIGLLTVRVRINKSYPPLSETSFKHAINGNYHSESHFSFELDKTQAGLLMALFTKASSILSTGIRKHTQTLLPSQTVQQKETDDDGWIKPKKTLKPKRNGWHGAPQQGQNASLKENFIITKDAVKTDLKWDRNAWHGALKQEEYESMEEISERNLWHEAQDEFLEERLIGLEDGVKICTKYERNDWHIESQQAQVESLEERLITPEDAVSANTNVKRNAWHMASRQGEDEFLAESIIFPVNAVNIDAKFERNAWHMAYKQGDNESFKDNSEKFVVLDAVKTDTNSPPAIRGEGAHVEVLIPTAMTEPCWPKEVKELREKNTLLEFTQRQMASEIESLKFKINELNNQLNSLQHKGICTDEWTPSDAWIVRDILDEQLHTGPDQKIFMLGGHSGDSWLQTADAIKPDTFEVTPLATMLYPRSYAAATVLMGQIHIFGGGNGQSWFKTAEYYDNEKNEWMIFPSMSITRGSLAGVTLGDRIYAIGGGDGQVNFAEVECYDFHLGMWMASTSMLNKRFGVSAVELEGTIYAMGGYNDRRYLRSVERYDPREALWSSVAPLHQKRGSLSATVLDGKIYAVGGYDGANILSSVEVYESRKDCWIEMESGMHCKRSYAAAVTVGHNIYVLGGYTGKQYLQSVEQYKMDVGWELVEHAFIGKRSFHAGIVL
ncbi:hypothetical protein L7F22_013797 [Adiantum nelumboides]|nr:hypothetical protein [Adiantum nelumboides]